jgi:hypothetical protein
MGVKKEARTLPSTLKRWPRGVAVVVGFEEREEEEKEEEEERAPGVLGFLLADVLELGCAMELLVDEAFLFDLRSDIFLLFLIREG